MCGTVHKEQLKDKSLILPIRFAASQLGEGLQLSEEGDVVVCEGDQTMGCAISMMPIVPSQEAEVKFEVRVEEIRSTDAPDGLCIGVVLDSPEQVARMKEPPETLDMFQKAWVVGYDGQSFNGATQEWIDIDWQPKCLKLGDIVGARVTKGGQLDIYINNVFTVSGPKGIPVHMPLYAAVGLMGATKSVRILQPKKEDTTSSTKLRISDLTSGSAMFVNEDGSSSESTGECSPGKSSLRLPNPTPEESLRNAKHEEESRRLSMASQDGWRRFAEPATPGNLQFSKEGDVVTIRGETGQEMAVVIGAAPLSPSKGQVYFEVCIEKLNERVVVEEGLCIGITLDSPSQVAAMKEVPLTIDWLPKAWSVGYDGQTFDGSTQEWADVSWQPHSLKTRDIVGALVTREGQLQIFVNDELVVAGPRGGFNLWLRLRSRWLGTWDERARFDGIK